MAGQSLVWNCEGQINPKSVTYTPALIEIIHIKYIRDKTPYSKQDSENNVINENGFISFTFRTMI